MGLFEMGKEKNGGSDRKRFKGGVNRKELENLRKLRKGRRRRK